MKDNDLIQEVEVIETFSIEVNKCDVEVPKGEMVKIIDKSYFLNDKDTVTLVHEIGRFRVKRKYFKQL